MWIRRYGTAVAGQKYSKPDAGSHEWCFLYFVFSNAVQPIV